MTTFGRELCLAARTLLQKPGFSAVSIPTGAFTIVHADADLGTLVAPARAVIREIDPEVAPRFRHIAEVLAAAVADRRLGALVLGGFAAVALVLAVVGIYGVLSYVVAQRTQEFGVRMALGARGADVWRLVIRQAGLLVVTGVTIGVVVSAWVTNLMQAMLFGITPTDGLTFAVVAAVLAVTALAACQVPALRATRADPLSALRAE